MSIARRTLLTGCLAIMGSGYPLAQVSRIPRVGFLTPATSDRTIPISAFRTALAELGYVEGQNVILEFRLARGDISRLAALAAELVALPADVIVVDGGIAMPAVMVSTKTIPVVMATAGDPVALGYVQSLSRPGGNITGFSLISGELNQKRLDLLRAAFPKAENVAVVFNPQNPTAQAGLAFVREAGERLGIRVALVELSSPEGIAGLRSEALRPDATPQSWWCPMRCSGTADKRSSHDWKVAACLLSTPSVNTQTTAVSWLTVRTSLTTSDGLRATCTAS